MKESGDGFDLVNNTSASLGILRHDVLKMAEHSAHVAVAMSCLDIIAALYGGVLRVGPDNVTAHDRDWFILSKGHGCMALYAVLARTGFFDPAELAGYAKDGSPLAEHPLAGKVPGIEFATGTLGHGLAVAAGIAKGLKLQGIKARSFVLLGDGECDEGSIWEAAAAASSAGLDNLVALVDWNGLQACGKCADISPSIFLPACWRSFGWQVEVIDGHDFHGLQMAMNQKNAFDSPRVIFCQTVKGKGVDFMEGDLEWHYRPVRGAEREEALRRSR